MLSISKSILDRIFTLSTEGMPYEICGYLAGTSERITEIFPMTNTDKSAEHYSLLPEEQFKVVKEIRRRQLELIGVYHSHPETPARMSGEDIRLAHDSNMVYVICSILTNEIKAFRIVKDKDTKKSIEEKLVVENDV